MHAVGLAFAWDFWSRHRFMLSLTGGYLLVLVLLVAAWPTGRLGAEIVVPLTIPLWSALPVLLAVFSHGDQGDIVGRDSVYPRRLFTLPLRTAALVGWPLGLGATAVALFWLVLTGLVLRPAGVPVPGPWVLVFLAALLAWLQALTWSPFPLPFLRIFATVLVLGGMITGVLLGSLFGVSPALLLAVSACLIPPGYLLAVVGVARARRGDGPAWKWPTTWRVAGADEGSPARDRPGLPSSAPATPFPSAAAALFWLEWGRSGFVLPLMVGLVVAPLLLFWFCITDPDKAASVLGIMAMYPLLFATAAGASLGNCNPGTHKTTAISPFIAGRPVTSAAMIAVKIRAALRITVVTWAMIFLVILPLVPFSLAGEVVIRLTRRLLDTQGVKGGALLTLLVLGLPALTWKGIVNQLWIGLSGRYWVAVTMALVLPIGLTALALFGVYVYFHPQVQNALLVAVPWVAGLLLLKLAAAVLVARALLRRGLVRPRTVKRFAVAWLAGAVVLFGLAFWLTSPEVCSPLVVGSAAVLLGLPLVRLGLAVLALDWNRHR